MRIKESLEFKDFIEMEEMERSFYDDEFIAPAEEAFRWFKKYPFSVKVVEVEGEIAGFMNLFPVIPAVAAAISSGTFNDRELTVEDIQCPIKATENLHLFLSCVVVRTDKRHSGVIRLLLNNYNDEVNLWGKDIKDVLMETVSKDGERFAEKLGMKPILRKRKTIVWGTSYDEFKREIP